MRGTEVLRAAHNLLADAAKVNTYRQLAVSFDVAFFDLAAHPVTHLLVRFILSPVGETKLGKACQQALLIEVACPRLIEFVEYEGSLLLALGVGSLEELGAGRAGRCARDARCRPLAGGLASSRRRRHWCQHTHVKPTVALVSCVAGVTSDLIPLAML